jgi:hypothetical protein
MAGSLGNVRLLHPRPAARRPSIAFADSRDGVPVGWEVDEPLNHMILSAPDHGAVTSATRVVALEAARQGADVRCCDATTSLSGLRGWPGITVCSRPRQIAEMIARAWALLRQRLDGPAHLPQRRVVLVVDEALLTSIKSSEHCPDGGPATAHVVRYQLTDLLMASYGTGINVLVTGAICGPELLPPRTFAAFGTKAAVGRITPAWSQELFGDRSIGQGVAAGDHRAVTIQWVGGLATASIRHLPDPRYPGHLSASDRELLLAMLPPGAIWERGGLPPARLAASAATAEWQTQ